MLFAYAASLEIRYRGLDDPAGLLRDATVQAYQRIRARGVHQFRFECSFRSYCRLILAREVLRLVRQQLERRPRHTEPDTEAVAAEVTLSPEDPDEIYALLQPCLGRLTPRELEVIQQLYIKAASPQAVADRLAISRNPVNVIAWRARRKLQRCMEERGYHTPEDVRNAVQFAGS